MSIIDFPQREIEFAPWRTPVENDELTLVSVRYVGSTDVTYHQEGFSLSITPEVPESCALEAIFLSKEKRAVVSFTFDVVSAFRVLDEHGLLELWHASAKTPRPGQTTFQVRGHKWQHESELSWIMGAADDYYSFMIATGFDCLEVVARSEAMVQLRPAVVKTGKDVPAYMPI